MSLARTSLLVLAIVLIAVPGIASARDYAVEVVVFRQWQQGGTDGERWPADPPALELDGRAVAPGEGGVRRLSPGAFQLGGVRARLESAGQYRVIDHFGWIQAGRSRSRSPLVLVPGSWRPTMPLPETAGLFGAFKVYAGRYLHIATDLRYRREHQGTVYPMHSQRRLRSGELHYLDHPVLGIIVQIRAL